MDNRDFFVPGFLHPPYLLKLTIPPPQSSSEPNHYTHTPQRSDIRTVSRSFCTHHHHHRHDLPPSSTTCCTIFETDRIRTHYRTKMPNESLNLNLLLRPRSGMARQEQHEDEATTKKYGKRTSSIVQNFSRAANAKARLRYARRRRSSSSSIVRDSRAR